MRQQATSDGPVLTTKRELTDFKKAAREYLKQASASPKKARQTLVRLGISTATGDLTKNYREKS